MVHARSLFFVFLHNARRFVVTALLALLLPSMFTLVSGAALSAQGPMVLMGIDAEDGNGGTGPSGGHGGKAPYLAVMQSILDKVTNSGSGILVIGGGKSTTDDVTEFWTYIGQHVCPIQCVTQIHDAAITTQSFAGFAVIAVASSSAETGGGLTPDENPLLNARACDIAAHVNGGGGLMGLESVSYCYLSKFGSITTDHHGYQSTIATAEGIEVGIPSLYATNWHRTYLDFPPIFRKLALQDGNPAYPAVIGTVYTKIKGIVFYDGNEMNCQDPGEEGLRFFTVKLLKNNDVVKKVSTSEGPVPQRGQYEFVVYRDDSEYTLMVAPPVFDENDEVISDQGFIGQDPGARWLATDCPGQPETVTADAACVDGPVFGVVYFNPADTKGAAATQVVYTTDFWSSEAGKLMLETCPDFPDILNRLEDLPPSGIGFLRDKNGRIFAIESKEFKQEYQTFKHEFIQFEHWITSKDKDQASFMLSREIAAALLNVKCGNLADTTVYVNRTGSAAPSNLVSFDELVHNAVSHLLLPENNKGINDTGKHAGGEWADLRAAIFECLNEFGGINNSSSESVGVYVWVPEEDPDPDAVPQPIESYTNIG